MTEQEMKSILDSYGLKKTMSMVIESYIFGKAIREDYYEVISKLTDVPIEQIKKRVAGKAEENRINLAKELKGLTTEL